MRVCERSTGNDTDRVSVRESVGDRVDVRETVAVRVALRVPVGDRVPVRVVLGGAVGCRDADARDGDGVGVAALARAVTLATVTAVADVVAVELDVFIDDTADNDAVTDSMSEIEGVHVATAVPASDVDVVPEGVPKRDTVCMAADDNGVLVGDAVREPVDEPEPMPRWSAVA